MLKKAAISLLLLFSVSGSVFLALAFYVADIVSPWSQMALLVQDHEVSSKAWVIFDAETGEILSGENEDELLPIASVTKLFIAEQMLNQPELFATTTITWRDLEGYGKSGNLEYGEQYDFYTLLFPLLLASSNDAALTLEHNFPQLLANLNQTYATDELATSFAESSGISVQNRSTAAELAYLGATLYHRSPHTLAITRLPYHAVAEGGWRNNNPVRDLPGYRGGKHGFTDEAGLTLIAFFDEPFKSDSERTLGYVLLGSNNLRSDIETLRKYAVSQRLRFALLLR